MKPKKKGESFTVEKKVKYSVIFGVVEVKSPYLWHKQQHQGIRPVVEKLGIHTGDRSKAVKRALTDLGSEESFGQAEQRVTNFCGQNGTIPRISATTLTG